MPLSPGPIVAALGGAGHRLTSSRRAIAQLISEQEGHFSAADLVSAARQRDLGVGRATVFRALELLEELEVVERVDLPGGAHAYVPCETTHHHHVICSSCGRSAAVGDRGLRSLAHEVAEQTGYRIDTHRLELYGRCPDCLALGGEDG